MDKSIPKISVTGTKGKTTVVNVIATVLREFEYNVLKVDTTGHYVNGKQRSTLADSKKIWNLVPSVAPGRYLYEFTEHPELQKNAVAVLECSLGCSTLSGMGYHSHDIGVFLNVFEDHLGSADRLQTKEDIATAKEFIFARIHQGGWAVFNADDPLVVSRLAVIKAERNVRLLPCGFNFHEFDLETHLQAGGAALSIRGNNIVLLTKGGQEVLVDLSVMPWTYQGQYKPSVWNALLAAAAIYALNEGEWNTDLKRALEAVRLDRFGGRLTQLRAANGAMIIADYAHEKVSLSEIAKLGRSMVGPGGKLIGILRLAPDRTDELIRETGYVVAPLYDQCIIFDKIDGYLREPRPGRSDRFPEVIGKVSELLANAIAEKNENVERVLREDLAVKRAAELTKPNDVVIYIVNDDIKRSLSFAQNSFGAEFL